MGENLFEEEFTIEALSQTGNPLERLTALVDFEMFRPALEEVLVKYVQIYHYQPQLITSKG